MYCSAIVAIFFAAICAGVKADAAASELSCNFANDYCSWTNDTTTKGYFSREFNTTKDRIIPTNCYFLLATSDSLERGTAKLDSQAFMLKESTVVLQVNFSYWLKNSGSNTQLKLFLVPLEGAENGTQRLVWDTRYEQKSTELWNATNVNIKDLAQAKRFKIFLQGITSGPEEVAAVERIVVRELTTSDVGSLDKLPNVTFHMEKAEENPNLCSGGSTLSSTAALFFVSAFAVLFVSQRF